MFCGGIFESAESRCGPGRYESKSKFKGCPPKAYGGRYESKCKKIREVLRLASENAARLRMTTVPERGSLQEQKQIQKRPPRSTPPRASAQPLAELLGARIRAYPSRTQGRT